jgi:uncharacterized sulfatase
MRDRPNIVWITLESTRADHTTLDGYSRDTTPNLERIARDSTGRYFSECFSHGIWTLSSSASILTGTYPSHHGAGMDGESIPDGLPTVPELLRSAGYRTACLSPNSHLSSATGLDRGFDEFSWVSKSTLREAVGFRTLLKYAAHVRSHGGGFTLDPRLHNRGYMLHDVAKRWVRSFEGDDEPFFMYLHHGGPHHPYAPPLRYRDRFTVDLPMSAEDAQDVAFHHHDRLHEHIAEGCEFSDDEWAALKAMYDAEIAYVDELVGDLFDYTESRDLGDTVFVVTADHGELFGERGLLAHMGVTDDAVSHVPLVVHGDDGLADHDGEMVQHADVMRTLLERAGADTESLQGRDLREESRDKSVVQRGAERTRRNLDTFEAHNPAFDRSDYPSGTVTALRTAEFRYQRSEDRDELFRLPDGRTDVSDEYPEIASDLETTLDEWLETTGAPVDRDSSDGEFTDAMKEQLSDLGYLVE